MIGSAAVLRAEALAMDLPQAPQPVDGPEDMAAPGAGVLDVVEFPPDGLEPRRPDADSGRAALDAIRQGVELVLDGRADALVTCPISKVALAAAGSPHPGHTEMLADLTGAGPPTMLLVGSGIRVALATIHVPLREVSTVLRAEDITHAAVAAARGLERFFGVERPRIGVCGLNPHCGEEGRFGDEEGRIIEPAIRAACEQSVEAAGPLPADSAFAQAAEGRYDALVAMYHDQGLVAAKFHGAHQAVNVTLGLPIIRTSVGHGTAFDIAGQGRADERGLVAAARLACQMVRRERARVREEARP